MTGAGRVYVVDDDEAARDSLAFLLECAGYGVTAFTSADAFLAADPPLEGACVVTDVRMPGSSGVELLGRVKARGASAPVIVITGHADVPMAIQAMKAGAADFIEKPFSGESILDAVGAALARELGEAAERAERDRVRARLAALSHRELQVLDGLVAGRPNKVIADDLGISARTVEVYRANVMTKMAAASLSELVRMVVRFGGTPGPGPAPEA